MWSTLIRKMRLRQMCPRLTERKSLKSSLVGITGKDIWKSEKDRQRRLYPVFCGQNALHSLNTKEPYDVNVKMPSDTWKKVLEQHRRRKSNLKEEELSQNGVKLLHQFWSASLLLRILGQYHYENGVRWCCLLPSCFLISWICLLSSTLLLSVLKCSLFLQQ